MSEPSGITVLIADDSPTDRLILEAIVTQAGHEVICANDGLEAIEVYKTKRPDIVLLDVLMPVQDGFSVAKQIKQFAGESFVPIVFLTALNDAESLVKCLAAGGDDFLPKPYSQIVIQAKIQSYIRMRAMHNTMLAQRNEIAKNNQTILQEQKIAKQIFDKITRGGCLGASNIRYSLSPLSTFNGDVVFASVGPSGNMLVMLGDFTGHGLPAAIGAMPLAGTFYEMVNKGFSAHEVLTEINAKLYNILPVDFFCCAALAEIDFRKKIIHVFNGGLPSAIIYTAGGVIERIRSTHLPLGVASRKDFQVGLEVYSFNQGDRLFLLSDGVNESRNKHQEMLGEERILEIFSRNENPDAAFYDLLLGVKQFVGDSKKTDDVSVLEVKMVDDLHAPKVNIDDGLYQNTAVEEWDFFFEIKPSSFEKFNSLLLILNVLLEAPGLRNHTNALYTVISELYTNALDHGVLGLQSSLKAGESGWGKYYELRKQRLAQVTSGYIRIMLNNRETDGGGELQIIVQDSGSGFNYSAVEQDTKFGGRGLMLVKRLCQSLNFSDSGRRVEAIFSWSGNL